ncbi:hypothetical protein L3X38_043103 [Prunus dulcis]|uniref:Uncharacterized protein n=1 Tax=Prunus dulcis TaxID=3755 RepID=A0AAD4YKY0_PRUDU|nr:hypothetical protein L3X38_043103 [Prunus dulcis]
MDWVGAILGLLALVYVLQAWLSKSKNKKRLPPGPRGFPLFGNLHMLGEFPHRYLHRLAQKHGDVMYLLLGLAPVVVASSPQAAEPFLKTHDLVFAKLLSSHKINSFKPMRKEELALLTKFIQEAARDRVTVDLSGKVASLAADMSCLMVFGKKYMDKEFDEGFQGCDPIGHAFSSHPKLW